LAVASDARDLAALTVRRLEDADHGAPPDLEARAWVEDRFRWDAVGATVDEILRTTVAQVNDESAASP
jgi:hypothetical protein